MNTNLTLKIVRSAVGTSQHFPFSTLNEASAKYRAFLSQNDLDMHGAGHCYIYDGKKIVAHVSFNGKVWAGAKYVAGAKPIWPEETPEQAAERAEWNKA